MIELTFKYTSFKYYCQTQPETNGNQSKIFFNYFISIILQFIHIFFIPCIEILNPL